jgi:hypothetical protein
MKKILFSFIMLVSVGAFATGTESKCEKIEKRTHYFYGGISYIPFNEWIPTLNIGYHRNFLHSCCFLDVNIDAIKIKKAEGFRLSSSFNRYFFNSNNFYSYGGAGLTYEYMKISKNEYSSYIGSMIQLGITDEHNPLNPIFYEVSMMVPSYSISGERWKKTPQFGCRIGIAY